MNTLKLSYPHLITLFIARQHVRSKIFVHTQRVKRNKDYDVLLAPLSTAVRVIGFIKKKIKI